MSQTPPYSNESKPGFPPHSSRQMCPTTVAIQACPGQANEIIHTDDASTKFSDSVRRKCYNCRTTDTSAWRRSSLTPGKVVCTSFRIPSSVLYGLSLTPRSLYSSATSVASSNERTRAHSRSSSHTKGGPR